MDVVRNAIISVSSRKELQINTTRTEIIKQYADELLKAVDAEEFQENFASFSTPEFTRESKFCL